MPAFQKVSAEDLFNQGSALITPNFASQIRSGKIPDNGAVSFGANINQNMNDRLGIQGSFDESPTNRPHKINSGGKIVRTAEKKLAKMKITVKKYVPEQKAKKQGKDTKVDSVAISAHYAPIKGVDFILPMPQDIASDHVQKWDGAATGGAGAAIVKGFTQGGDTSAKISSTATEVKDRIGNSIQKGAVGAIGGDPAKNALEFNIKKIDNDKKEVLYRGTEFRQFNFKFDFAPESEEEVAAVMTTIYGLKYHSAAEVGASEKINYPDLFHIEFLDRNDQVVDFGIVFSDEYPLALTSLKVNYTPDGLWQTFQNGHPIHTSIELSFIETELMYKSNIVTGATNRMG